MMREIDTRITTYEPELAWGSKNVRDDPVACMLPVEDGSGYWVSIAEHDHIVRELQKRITYLANCYAEALEQLRG